MAKLKIQIIKLGDIKNSHILNFIEYLKRKKNYSELFEVHEIAMRTLPRADIIGAYSSTTLSNIVKKGDAFDIAFAITEASLIDGYFFEYPSPTVSIISLHRMDDILAEASVGIKNYILLMLYRSILCYYIDSRDEYEKMLHDDHIDCPFNEFSDIRNIIQATTKPRLCYDCISVLSKKQLPDNLFETLEIEFNKIKKPTFYRIKAWIKSHPIISIIITFITTIIINVISALIWDFLKSILC